jgi:hypothetical protein
MARRVDGVRNVLVEFALYGLGDLCSVVSFGGLPRGFLGGGKGRGGIGRSLSIALATASRFSVLRFRCHLGLLGFASLAAPLIGREAGLHLLTRKAMR